MIVPSEPGPTPIGWDEMRWRKLHDNCKRAEQLTGVVPFGAEGWEIVAVILMDKLEPLLKEQVNA